MEPARDHVEVQRLLMDCPSLANRLDLDDGPYGVLGRVAQLVREGQLSEGELERVFGFFNTWAARPDCDENLLGAGALEILNDDRETALLARRMLKGRALELVEELRLAWGQPDYTR